MDMTCVSLLRGRGACYTVFIEEGRECIPVVGAQAICTSNDAVCEVHDCALKTDGVPAVFTRLMARDATVGNSWTAVTWAKCDNIR